MATYKEVLILILVEVALGVDQKISVLEVLKEIVLILILVEVGVGDGVKKYCQNYIT